MVLSIRRGGCLALGALLSAACGNGDDLDPYAGLDGAFPPAVIGPAQARSPVVDDGATDGDALPAAPAATDPIPGGSAAGQGNNLDGEEAVLPPQVSVDPGVCATPNGVSGTPRTLAEAIILMNSLPRPTSLACFLQALSRPLDVYLTSSDDSLQPSPGARSPRTFIVFEPLVMSIVFEGPAHIALELGYRSASRRSIKTEILFPLTTDVTYTNLFDEVQVGESTRCSACHTGEVQTVNPSLPVDVFESDIIEPFSFEEVDVESLRAERVSCNPSLEPERCELLAAFFDFGTVQPAPQGIMF
jgi:hypothetical protein